MPPTSALSMEQVARAAGVSASTVSRALRDDPRISAPTRERVRRWVRDLGYRPNPLVSALMTQLRDGQPPIAKCNLAWLDFFSEPEEWRRDPVQCAFYAGAHRRAQALGYALSRVLVGKRSADRIGTLLLNRGIRGVLFPNFDASGGVASRLPLDLQRFTTVGVGTRYESPFLHYSSDDQFESGRLAVQKLWERGYRRIGYVGDPRIERIVNGRFYAGYHATLRTEFNATPLPPLLTDRAHDVCAWVKKTRTEAVVSAHRAIYAALRGGGLRLPDDVALAHLNVEDAEGISGARSGEIAGIRQDNVGVGAGAAELLVSLLYHNEQGVPLHPRGMQVQGTWVEGATVRSPPGRTEDTLVQGLAHDR
ncbi:MAG TPA: LacI family DNA-binding transcriptional regulator [Opitutaceae bacterium]|jgi:DNA-binding LacI/PurR family transcriptional regulator|nr:LacI family DNA-binding transcriptional regulator [Opitutaceae bacterium]HRE06004.1 LacI family DNA-binding transcriptional regulator [Opitutaceae bacterium]